VIFIADADKPAITKDLAAVSSGTEGNTTAERCRVHGEAPYSKVYSFVLPVPIIRDQTPLVYVLNTFTLMKLSKAKSCVQRATIGACIWGTSLTAQEWVTAFVSERKVAINVAIVK
jgi:hypothetical protein